MAPAQVRKRVDFDAGHVIAMLDARFPPCSDFDGVIELGTNVE
jgi:hypothetical protein